MGFDVTMKAQYLVWNTAALPNVCNLAKLAGVAETYRLVDGDSLESEIDGARMTMDPDTPDATLLADVLINPYAVIVASERLVEFLKARNVAKVEYLPVAIINHRGRPIKEKYFIVHPIKHVDCLDVDASGGRWAAMDDTVIDKVKRIVLVDKKVDAARAIFRPKPLVKVVILRRDLAKALDDAGFTGSKWMELEKYPRG